MVEYALWKAGLVWRWEIAKPTKQSGWAFNKAKAKRNAEVATRSVAHPQPH